MLEIRVPDELDVPRAGQLRDQIRDALSSCSSVLVLRGSAECFCRGVSLSAIVETADPRPAVLAVAESLERLLHAPVPTIALVEGAAVGGGVGLLAACDRVLATPMATFALPEMLYGLVPLLIEPVLRRRVTPSRFLWIALSGLGRTAAQAQEIGLIDEIVPPAEIGQRLAATERILSRVDRQALANVRSHLLPVEQLHAELERATNRTIERLIDPAIRNRMTSYVREGLAPWEGGQ